MLSMLMIDSIRRTMCVARVMVTPQRFYSTTTTTTTTTTTDQTNSSSSEANQSTATSTPKARRVMKNTKLYVPSQLESTASAQYSKLIELFLDATVRCNGLPIRAAGFGWTVKNPIEFSSSSSSSSSSTSSSSSSSSIPSNLYRWDDESRYPHRVARIEMNSPMPRVHRFIEIHFDAWLMLLHQHDRAAPQYRPSQHEGFFYDTYGNWSKGKDDLLRNWVGPPHINGNDRTDIQEKPLTIYHGLTIPEVWLREMKKAYWPEMYQPNYEVSYFEFFRSTQAMRELEENAVVEWRRRRPRTLDHYMDEQHQQRLNHDDDDNLDDVDVTDFDLDDEQDQPQR